MIKRLLKWLSGFCKVNYIRDSGTGQDYLIRYHVLSLGGRNPFFNVYLHHFVGSDPLPASVHNHPWPWAWTIGLAGWYVEQRVNPNHFMPNAPFTNHRVHRAGSIARINGYTRHRVDIPVGGESWTLFIHGRWSQVWGFTDWGDANHFYKWPGSVTTKDPRWWRDPETKRGREYIAL